jgi:hypothetical protein
MEKIVTPIARLRRDCAAMWEEFGRDCGWQAKTFRRQRSPHLANAPFADVGSSLGY